MSYFPYKKYFDLHEIIANIKSYMPDFNEEAFLKAFSFAENAHKTQTRKDGTTPYIIHPVETVRTLAGMHADQDVLISAMLHDVPEDTKHEINEIKAQFGPKVAFLVDGITKLSKVHYLHNMPERQIESLKKLFLHSAKDPRVILIKLADRLHNMETLMYVEDPDKRLRISSETLEIYVPIANLLGIEELKMRLEDLCFKNLFPAEYQKLKEKVENNDKNQSESVNKFISKVKMALTFNKINTEIYSEKRGLYNIYKKLCSKNKTIDAFDSRVAVRMIVKNIPDCYRVLGIIHGIFTPKTGKFKDYIANPKINGYRSLHSTVFGSDGVPTEVHICTKEMRTEAAYGIASHFFFEKENEKSDYFVSDKRSSWVNKILEMEKALKNSDDFLENLKLDILEDRIFVFTPRGQTIDLPKNATALDFAYAIHTEVGNHAFKVEINNEFKPITTTQKTGDVVNIILSKKSHPEPYLLSFAKTNMAKNKIRLYLKRINKNKKLIGGHKFLQKEFDIARLGPYEGINFKKLNNKLSNKFGKKFKNWNALFESVGEGSLNPTDIVKILNDKYYNKPPILGTMGLLSRFFYRTQKKGIKVNIKIVGKNRFGILNDISSVTYKYANDVMYFKGWAGFKIEYGLFRATALVDDFEKVSKMFDELEKIDDVYSVKTYSNRGILFFYFVSAFTIFVWISHPLVLKIIIDSGLTLEHSIISNVIFYFGLFLLIFSIVYLTNLIKKNFPLIRNQTLLWITSFAVSTVAMSILIFESFYFNLNLSLFVLFLGIIFIYSYLGINYWRSRKLKKIS